MKVIDPHIHLWNTAECNLPWLVNPSMSFSGDNNLLPQCHDVPAWLRSTTGVDVQMSVNVEANPADSLLEACWLQRQADAPDNGGHPHGIVAAADLSDQNFEPLLEKLHEVRNLRGIRQILNVHADARYNYVKKYYLLDPVWQQNLKLLRRYNWSFDLQIYPAQVTAAVKVIRANPEIMFILNHGGMLIDRSNMDQRREWNDGLVELAACANTAIKISGLVMFDHHWTIESLRPIVLAMIAAFGPARCMFASNFPIDGLHATYQALWSAYAAIVADTSASEQAQLFSDNAARYYRLG